MDDASAQMGTLLIGVMNVFMTVISTLIVDKAGRKTLLAIGFGSMAVDTIILCICLVLAVRIIYYVASAAIYTLIFFFFFFFRIKNISSTLRRVYIFGIRVQIKNNYSVKKLPRIGLRMG